VPLVDCILKNKYDILRKDRVYDIKVIPFDVTLKYKEYGTMTVLCRAIRKISYRGNGTFHFNYSMEHDRIYITSPVETEMTSINDNLRDVLGFKQNIISGKNTGTVSGMDHVIFSDYTPGFASDSCIFLYASFVETSRVGNSNVPLLRVLERKTTHEHVHHYNIKHLQYFPVNTSYLELCQLTLRSELGDPIAITKGLVVITCHFRPIRQQQNG
jgi:hypothetical protein